MIATDAFDGTGALGAQWKFNDNNGDTMSRSSGLAIADAGGISDAAARYTHNWPVDQYSEVVLGPTTSGQGSGYGPAVRLDPNGTSSTGQTMYRLVASDNGYELGKFVNAVFTSLDTAGTPTFAPGDRVRLEIRGNQLTMKKNGVVFSSIVVDSAIKSGHAGIAYSSTATAGDGIASWEAGDFFAGRPRRRERRSPDSGIRWNTLEDIRNWW